MTVLITGGAGYIGSHCCVAFLEAGLDVVVVDNLANARSVSLDRVEKITGKTVPFRQADLRDQAALEAVLREFKCDSVVHFAGLKAVGESVAQPLNYYDNNVVGTHRLLSAMDSCNVKKLIFSSSATVYGEPQYLPLTEDHPTGPVNPYGRTKLMVEDMLRDVAVSDADWRIALLRYFNPVGAHASGLIGEDPLGVPNNLMPIVSQVASGRRDKLTVFGNDYDTPDGTGVRDYIHVVDLADGHLSAHTALDHRAPSGQPLTANLGTGEGYSVLQMIKAFERCSNREISYEVSDRRPGDVASCYADTSHAKEVLGWTAKRSLEDMCNDTWNFVCKNPKGYEVP